MFWFNGWSVYLMKGVSNMAIKKYIGARYAPKFMGAWDKSSEYAALSVVYTNEQSYVSRKTVPANTEITNTEFWIKSADWNAQVTQYNQNVEQYKANVDRYNQNVETYNADVNDFFDATIHAYNTKEDMVKDTSIKLEYTLITCGDTAIGDGGGRLYKVAGSTSITAIALKNGLFAVPFTFASSSAEIVTLAPTGTSTLTGGTITMLSISASDVDITINYPNFTANTTFVINVDAEHTFNFNVTGGSNTQEPGTTKMPAGQYVIYVYGYKQFGPTVYIQWFSPWFNLASKSASSTVYKAEYGDPIEVVQVGSTFKSLTVQVLDEAIRDTKLFILVNKDSTATPVITVKSDTLSWTNNMTVPANGAVLVVVIKRADKLVVHYTNMT